MKVIRKTETQFQVGKSSKLLYRLLEKIPVQMTEFHS